MKGGKEYNILNYQMLTILIKHNKCEMCQDKSRGSIIEHISICLKFSLSSLTARKRIVKQINTEKSHRENTT
jgi:hypothetical protein